MSVVAAGAAAEARGLDWVGILREAALAAFIAFMLTVTMVGLHLVNRPAGLTVETRFIEVGVSVLLVFLGRLGFAMTREGAPLPALAGAVAVIAAGLVLPLPSAALKVITVGGGAIIGIYAAWTAWRRRLSREERQSSSRRFGERVQEGTRYILPVMVAFAAVLPILFPDRSTIDLATLVLTYVMLGWGLNIVVGLAGLLDLGYVAFYAVGAYAYALLAVNFDLSFWVCLPLAGLLAATAGLILGFPVLRLRGDYFAIVTLGFGEIIRIILLNWYEFTRGPDGISGIPRPSFFGIAEFTRRPDEGEIAFHTLMGLEYSSLHRLIFLYYLILILALVVNFVSIRVRRLPVGRAWEAIREDDVACQALGLNRRNVKLCAFTISAAFGGIAGSFFATRQGFISPESFTFIESAIILAIVVLGGMGSQTGVALASVLMIGVPEWLREIQEYRMLVFGAAMVLIMVWRPRGLLAHRDPTIRLHSGSGRRRMVEGRARAEARAADEDRARQEAPAQ